MLRPTFLGFETAKRALNMSQLGMDTVGHNISNINTQGYTRQRMDQISISSGGYKTQYQIHNQQFPGQGSKATGINQIRDPFLDNRYRSEATNFGTLNGQISGLADLEGIFDEIMKDGIHSKFSDLIAQLDKFAADPTSKELAMVVRNTANQLAQILNKNASDLENVYVGQKEDLNIAVEQNVNNILSQIALLNTKIREDNFYGNPSNELNDQRNMLLDQLSEFMDVRIVRTPVKISDDITIEHVRVELKDVKDKDGNPVVLVDGGDFNKLAVKNGGPTDSGKIGIDIVDGYTGRPIVEDIGDDLMSGFIKGALDVLNGDGPDGTTGNGFRGIPYHQRMMDEYAQKIAEKFNEINSISNAEAFPPALPAQNKPLFTAGGKSYADFTPPNDQLADINGEITAKNLTISGDWKDDPLFMTTTKKDLNGGLNEANSDNLLKFKEMIKQPFQYNNGTKANFQEFISTVQADLGLDVELISSKQKASFAVISGLADRRDAVSSVSMDEEGINLMTFQNYFNAASRYMTTLDEALGTIIQGMGVVGR